MELEERWNEANLWYSLYTDENVDDQPVRGTRLLPNIYERCNAVVLEPTYFTEAKKDPKWITEM